MLCWYNHIPILSLERFLINKCYILALAVQISTEC